MIGRVTELTPDETPAQRLDRLMNLRRLELGLRWGTVAELADIRVSTLGAVRRGSNPPSPLTMRGLDKALRLESGNIGRILAGGDLERLDPPTESLTTTAGDDLAAAMEIAEELKADLARKKGPRTERQQREIQRWRLSMEGLRDALSEDEPSHLGKGFVTMPNGAECCQIGR